MSLNCRSLREKIHEVMEMVTANNIDILCVQETWLRKCDQSQLEEIKEYNYEIVKERKTRKCDRGGGVAIIYKKHLSLKRVMYKQYPSFESISVTIQKFAHQIVITNLYYPGYSEKHRFTQTSFLDDFEKLVEDELCSCDNLIVGDFNVHTEDLTSTSTTKLLRILNEQQLFLHKTRATHNQGGTIDLIIGNNYVKSRVDGLNVLDKIKQVSDHFPIQFVLQCDYISETKKVNVRCQSFTDQNITEIKSLITDSSQLAMINENLPVDDMVKIYNECLSDICNKVTPVVIKNVRERTQQVWYTHELQDQKREKRRAERKYLKQQSSENLYSYKEKCENYYSNIKNTRTEYYKNVLTNKKDDLKAVYNIVNKLSGDGNKSILPKTKSDKQLANQFSIFFKEKIENIRKKIHDDKVQGIAKVHIRSSSTSSTDASSLRRFEPISENELTSIYNSMNKKNFKKDPIPVKVLAECFSHVSPYILKIVNMSISTGIFPINFKHATVIPLVKDINGDLDDLKNYRPLHNTPLISKIIEKCILVQINAHLQVNNLYNATQSGYKKHHSCETALVKIVNDIQTEMQQNNISIVLMLDQSAAFDTVDIPTLIIKLKQDYKIYDEALKWLSSYLEGRTFSVVVNGEESESVSMDYGVPQGTILAPLLYTLYTGDLNQIVENMGLKIHSFADDTNIYMGFKPINSLSEAKIDLDRCVKEIRKYMTMNYLKLNIDKTQIIFCGMSKDIELYNSRLDDFEQVLGGDCKRTKHGKTLGVKLDENLKFNELISETCSSGYYKLNKLKNMRSVLDLELRLTLVKCFILTKIDYCNILLNGATKKQVYRLQKMVNAAVRFIYNIKKSARVTPYMIKAHILPVSSRIQYKSCMYVYKILNGQAPGYICELIRRKQSLRGGLRSSADDTTVEPICGGKTIAASMCKTWNDLPASLRQSGTLDTFKKNLKTHYFRIAYDL